MVCDFQISIKKYKQSAVTVNIIQVPGNELQFGLGCMKRTVDKRVSQKFTSFHPIVSISY